MVATGSQARGVWTSWRRWGTAQLGLPGLRCCTTGWFPPSLSLLYQRCQQRQELLPTSSGAHPTQAGCNRRKREGRGKANCAQGHLLLRAMRAPRGECSSDKPEADAFLLNCAASCSVIRIHSINSFVSSLSAHFLGSVITIPRHLWTEVSACTGFPQAWS